MSFARLLIILSHYSGTNNLYNLTPILFRYYAVVHPMRAQYLCTTSQAKKVTCLVWVVAAILAVPTGITRVSIGSDVKIFRADGPTFAGKTCLCKDSAIFGNFPGQIVWFVRYLPND